MGFILSLLACSLMSCSGESRAPVQPPKELTGNWEGKSGHNLPPDILPTRVLRIRLNIAPDGNVTGSIGDADIMLTQLHLKKGLKRRSEPVQYIARFDLNGNIVNAIGFHRNGGVLRITDTGTRTITCSFESYGNDAVQGSRVMRMDDIILKRPSVDE